MNNIACCVLFVNDPKGLPNALKVIGVSHLLYPPQLKQHPHPKFHKYVMAETSP